MLRNKNGYLPEVSAVTAVWQSTKMVEFRGGTPARGCVEDVTEAEVELDPGESEQEEDLNSEGLTTCTNNLFALITYWYQQIVSTKN
ncbi:hypothetical protein ONS95_004484 [Cadophora gregata]|uniref:uncharacterized protein n=1 Tax=Cadophora gregata TaxID=51156 RepID=UPI0026DC65DF|nr:uncharacterized protein ONS95_004484 [Cadophora gregata]KAK0105975.1 hypothetical protein ONS95_004484 [Cadophora gregata]